MKIVTLKFAEMYFNMIKDLSKETGYSIVDTIHLCLFNRKKIVKALDEFDLTRFNISIKSELMKDFEYQIRQEQRIKQLELRDLNHIKEKAEMQMTIDRLSKALRNKTGVFK